MMKKYYFKNINYDLKIHFMIEKTVLKEDFSLHSHVDFSELVVVVSGSAKHLFNDTLYDICSGDIFILNKDSKHAFLDVHSLELYNIMYQSHEYLDNMDSIKELLGYQALFVVEPLIRSKIAKKSMTRLDSQSFLFILSNLEALTHEFNSEKPGYDIMVKSYFTQLVVSLSRYYSDHFLEKNTVWYFSNVLSHIESNYTTTIQLEELAYISHLSLRQFQRSFKEYFQMTPYDYILQKRIKKACFLLKDSQLLITEIAFSCGFSDANYFSRLFKNKTSKTPLEYRFQPK